MKLVYICSPLRGDLQANMKKATQYCEVAARLGVIPLAPHTIFTQYLNDKIPEQRERGLVMGLTLLRRCDEMWVCGNVISQGMRDEIQFCQHNGISIKHMKEVSVMNTNNPEFKKHHTQKSYTIQQYRPIYSVNYNITIMNDDVVSNVAKVLFNNGKLLEINGLEHGINFMKMEAMELKQAVDKIVTPLIEAEQNKLWQETGLNAYPRIHPIQDSTLPYFVLDQNEYGRFGYCPLAPEKFAVLLHNDFGKPFMGLDNRMFGIYDNQLSNLLIKESMLDSAKIVDSLKELEPIAVREFKETYILGKLEQIRQENGARPFIFYSSGLPELVSLPAEAADYLTPEEMKLAEELISRQEQPDQEEALDETYNQIDAEEQDFEEELEEDFEPEMCM